MKSAYRLVAGTALLMLAAALAACHAPDSSSGAASESMELKLYNVPVAQSNDLSSALGIALGGRARVSLAAPGKVLVYAPRTTQASISETIATLAKASVQQAITPQVGVHFWVVNGESGTASDDAALKPLASALDSVRRSMGPLHFKLVQTVSARASADDHNTSIVAAPDRGNARSFDFAIKGIDGDMLELRVGYYDANDRGLYKFQSEIDLRSGHYVVLAQGPGACARAVVGESDPPCPVTPALRLLIIRADIMQPQT